MNWHVVTISPLYTEFSDLPQSRGNYELKQAVDHFQSLPGTAVNNTKHEKVTSKVL